MRFEIVIIAITAFLILNTYYDGKYTKLVVSHKKYIQMGVFALLGVTLYLMVKKNPARCKNMLMHANNVIKYMPIDKSSMGMISPLLDFTTMGVNNFNPNSNSNYYSQNQQPQEGGINQTNPGHLDKQFFRGGNGHATKRSVSETKKKHVASMQNWKCGDCNMQLNAWFEVDHKTRLEYGGSNEVSNLVALCRECHGKKTAHENM